MMSVVLEDHVWVAIEVTIMPGAHIERNCIINPHVVVQGRVKTDSILQIDPWAYSMHNLRQLQLISKKDTAYWHRQIIAGFLDSRSLSYRYDEKGASYTVPGRLTFVSRPESNTIEIHIGKARILYDLEGFIADESRRPVHRKFMAFVRLHYGLILKTRYR